MLGVPPDRKPQARARGMRGASKQYRIGSPAVTCSAPGDFATGCPLGRLGIVRESQRCPGFCACLRPAPHDREVSASGGCCPAAKRHLWLSLRLPHACNGHDGVAGVKQDRLLTIGRRVEYPCGVPPVRKPQARARGMRVAPCPAPHRCESASDFGGSPARGRQKSRRSIAAAAQPLLGRSPTPLPPSSKVPSRRSTKGRCGRGGLRRGVAGFAPPRVRCYCPAV